MYPSMKELCLRTHTHTHTHAQHTHKEFVLGVLTQTFLTKTKKPLGIQPTHLVTTQLPLLSPATLPKADLPFIAVWFFFPPGKAEMPD